MALKGGMRLKNHAVYIEVTCQTHFLLSSSPVARVSTRLLSFLWSLNFQNEIYPDNVWLNEVGVVFLVSGYFISSCNSPLGFMLNWLWSSTARPWASSDQTQRPRHSSNKDVRHWATLETLTWLVCPEDPGCLNSSASPRRCWRPWAGDPGDAPGSRRPGHGPQGNRI